jgi:hypothetical protein
MAAPTFRQAASPTGGPTPGIVPTGLTLAATLRQLGFTLPFVGEFNEALVATPDVIGRILDAAGSTCFTGQVTTMSGAINSALRVLPPYAQTGERLSSLAVAIRQALEAVPLAQRPFIDVIPLLPHCEAQLIQLILITRMCTTCIAKATQQGS